MKERNSSKMNDPYWEEQDEIDQSYDGRYEVDGERYPSEIGHHLLFGDKETVTEEKLILCKDWDEETYRTVAAKIKVHMKRKVRYSVANGHMPAGGSYLTEDEYAQAMTLRIMKERHQRIYEGKYKDKNSDGNPGYYAPMFSWEDNER